MFCGNGNVLANFCACFEAPKDAGSLPQSDQWQWLSSLRLALFMT
jgi:hypothetical protein